MIESIHAHIKAVHRIEKEHCLIKLLRPEKINKFIGFGGKQNHTMPTTTNDVLFQFHPGATHPVAQKLPYYKSYALLLTPPEAPICMIQVSDTPAR